MRMKFFWIPALDSAAVEEELNGFLAGHRIVHVEKCFCSQPDNTAGWALCVEWLPGSEPAAEKSSGRSGKVDYREVLDAPTFKIFAALRAWRKDVATAEGVPVYSVATNEQLAAIARERLRTRAGLEKVHGFGASRMEKYAADILAVCEREIASPNGAGPGKS